MPKKKELSFEDKESLKDFVKTNEDKIKHMVEVESIDELLKAIYDFGKAQYQEGWEERSDSNNSQSI